MASFTVDNPASLEPYCHREYLSTENLSDLLEQAKTAQQIWEKQPLQDRIAVVQKVGRAFQAEKQSIAKEISSQMGKPITQALGEVDACCFRLNSLCDQAQEALREVVLPQNQRFNRRITREPLGVILNIAAWNYPLLVPVNVVVAGVLAGNSILLKHSPRTPICGEQFERLFRLSGAPRGLVSALHVDHSVAAEVIADNRVNFVSFTGSVRGGLEVYKQASKRVLGMGMELGGKDAAYVLADCNLETAAASLAEGAFFNAGQSCCAVERIFVDASVYRPFIERLLEQTKTWVPGDPTLAHTNLGPMALPDAHKILVQQIEDAVDRGGELLTGGNPTRVNNQGRYFEPTVIINTSDDMVIMSNESFGPIIGISPVADAPEAIRRINSSPYGLTASIWGSDSAFAEKIGKELQVGTIFFNRCDYLDPELPWTGVKESGLGSSLGAEGFHRLTQPKSWNFCL
jgi:acyl-CoA reductase-like NAD-dependent aldehyde dehydrogenase